MEHQTTALILLGPAAFGFVVGGLWWAYAVRTSRSPAGAAEKFRVYDWLIGPLAMAAYAGALAANGTGGADALRLGRFDGGVAAVVAVSIAALFAVSLWSLRRGERDLPPDVAHAFRSGDLKDLPTLIVTAPVAEEFVFRGVGLALLSDVGAPAAVALTALAFGLAHVKPAMIVNAFVAGLVLGEAYLFSGGLLAPVAIHAGANLAAWSAMRWSRA